METVQIDQNRTDLLVQKVLDALNYGSLALMISVGHRTGLYEVMKGLPFSTSNEIAEKAGLNERYVREWLGAMTAGGIVDHDPETKTYSLPEEHSVVLTKNEGSENLAVHAQYIGLMGTVEDKIVERFRIGGGVAYPEFKRFHEVMAEESAMSVIPALLNQILPLVPGLKEKLERGIKVADMGCGRGQAITFLAKTFPNSTFIGYDLSEEAITWARRNAAKENLLNIKFVVKDLTNFDIRDKFDFITTFDAVHDQARPDLLLKGIYNALNEDGVYLMQDINGSSHHHLDVEHPLGTFLYTISTYHCMTVSLAQGGVGLGTMWGKETAVTMLKAAGFKNININNLPQDIMNDYYVIRKR